MAEKVKWYDKEVNSTVAKKVIDAVKEGCILVEGDAKRIQTPHVKTGRLRSSITHEVEGTITGATGRVGTNVKYARRHELGFVGVDSLGRKYNQKPYPYLRPALHKNEKKILKLFKDIVK